VAYNLQLLTKRCREPKLKVSFIFRLQSKAAHRENTERIRGRSVNFTKLYTFMSSLIVKIMRTIETTLIKLITTSNFKVLIGFWLSDVM
jgi:hypothetical protein